MNLLDALCPACCSVDFTARTKQDTLRNLAVLMAGHPAVAALGADEICRRLQEREDKGTTGLGRSVGLPHARIPGLQEFIVGVAIAPRGVDFEALDRRKCRLLFVVLGPEEDTSGHLKALAAISRITGSARRRRELLSAPSPEALHEVLVRQCDPDAALADSAPSQSMRVLLVILYDEDLLYDVLQYFLEQGIEGATVLEGMGMGHYISNVPVFADYIGFMQQRKQHSQTIFTLIPAEREAVLLEGLERVTGDMQTRQGAMVITVDTVFHKGSMRML
jgi:nitrogen PTS system EIIA component